jgi:hypothetical protein
MRNLNWKLLMCFTLYSVFASAAGETELQIKKFRFNRHVKLGFERLVIEFETKTPMKTNPIIRLVPNASGKETTVHINQASLVGAIPESAINDSYVKKSQYFGPVSINSDASAGFEIRTFIKQSHSVVDAFWLDKPSRLIIDVFPKSSDRAQGPNIVLKRTTASLSRKAEPQNSNPEEKSIETEKKSVEIKESKPTESATPEWTKMEKPSYESILCFPAHTQVKANIAFDKGLTGTDAVANVDATYGAASKNNQDIIVCYPKGAQVTPKLKFQPSETPFYGRADLDAKGPNNRTPSSALIPIYPGNGGGYQPPMMGYPGQNYYAPLPRFTPQQPNFGNRDQWMNNDADVALSFPEDGNRQSYQDSFSQKAPPMSLGKKLAPPGQR